MQQIFNKKVIQKIMALFVILVLSNFIMSTRVYADGYAASSQDTSKGTTSTSTGKNTTAISTAVDNGIKKSDIIAGIKSALNLNDEDAEKVYQACYSDVTKITVTFNINGSGQTKTPVFGSVNKKDALTDDVLQSIKDGSYQTNMATKVDNNQPAQQTESDESDSDIFGVLFSPFTALFIGIGDAINYIFRTAIVGSKAADGQGYKVVIAGQRAIDYMKANDATNDSEPPTVYISRTGIDHSYGTTYAVSAIDYTPVEIFAGRISALNANFFKTDQDYDKLLGGEDKSIVRSLRDVVSNWYVAIRNIAIVGLMSVLLYMGIRIVISSSSNDKAKYKQMLVDWLVALCLIFFMHYIMAFTMTVSEQIIKVFTNDEEGTINECIIRLYDSTDNNGNPQPVAERQWKSNFVNVARMKTQYDNLPAKFGYMALYFAFTGYTVYFTIIYLKRLLMLAFYTMIAPAVALTYPLDKIRDGKAQAFNFWLKDYTFYALLPVLHMLLYTVFVSSALDLASQNMIYAIFAMAFIVPAEKIVKKMFHIQGNTEERIGGFAGGALAGSLFNLMKKPPKPPKGAPGAQKEEKIPRIPKNSNTFNGGVSSDAPKPWELDAANAQTKEENANKTKTTTQDAQPNQNVQTEQMDGNTEVDKNGQKQLENDSNTHDTPDIDNNIPKTYVGDVSMDSNTAKEIKEDNPLRKLKNNFDNEKKRRMKLTGGKRAVITNLAKKAGKGAVRAAFTLGVGGAAAAVGVGLGMVGGDVSDVFKYGAAGLSAGAYLGNKVVGQAAVDTLTGKNSVGSFASNVFHGGYEENQKRKARNNYINDRDNLERIAAKHPEKEPEEVREWAAREFDIQYATGVDNAKFADKALQLEDEYKNAYKSAEYSDEEAAKCASEIAKGALTRTDDWSKSELNDRKKRAGFVADRAEEYMKIGVSDKNVAILNAEHEIDLTRMIYGQKKIGNFSVPKKGENSKAKKTQPK